MTTQSGTTPEIDTDVALIPRDLAADAAGRPRRPRRSRHRPAWEEPPGKVGAAVKFVVLAGVVLAVVFPLWTVVVTSLSTQAETIRAGGLVVVPGELTLNAYKQILSGGVVTRAALVSIGITAVGTVISTIVSVLAAYGLSRPSSLWHRPILFVFLITMFFGAGLIPTYLVVSGLGLVDSYWALILPGAVSAFNVLILRNFFMGLEPAILDAARIDGAGDWRILGRVVLPMSRAVVAVIALFYGVGYWNAFFNAILYINDNAKWPLQLVLRSYVLQGVTLPGSGVGQVDVATGAVTGLPVKMAVMVLAIVPILVVYPFVQRHFTKGVIFGAIKG
ncbi:MULTISPECIES: carbohydrate ABC transporter permease [Cellulomonas]|jgi:putative aldouronate transport system permease protein|uniref:Aldouronate transport system permease protein n=1 Tax=Cellulomonas iranensis TaxID=76862 RepID=A0ABU0GFV2_9CELL|nr:MULTISPECIES: carbohydrate ABC transporter permease [Cellulomonas]MBO9569122.1 carbohydrate ABC transporter permease [Cellulomonas iranensis]MDQ0424235.1 putative aldouronate transport system permease protein [Cellulomonas iranensis]TFH70379.1 carbohydrate ABC transporter permease [Cellulomonas sp. HD19AZ1]UCN13785.1 carbohydrate ABC transporter permease [Cellulomonas iranensis]